MTTQFLLRCSLGLALGSCVLAQGVKPPPSGATGGTGSRTNPTQPGGVNPNATPTPDFSRHPLFLSGRVIMEDGTAPPDAVMIQLVCRSNPHTIGRTDPKGTFSVDLSDRSTMMTMADASETDSPSFGSAPGGPPNGGLSNPTGAGGSNAQRGMTAGRDLIGCDLQGTLAGFRSDVLHLNSRRSLDDPDVGTIIMHRLANVEGTTISATSGMAPKDAKKAMEKGINALKKDKWDEAQKEFGKAVDIYPKYAVAWVELGRTQEHHNDLESARQSYAKALEADSKLVTPYLALASLAARQQKWQEVSRQTDRVLSLNPVDFPQAYLLNAMSNFYLKNLDAAEKSAREGLTHDAEHHYAKMYEILGVVLARKQDYVGAADQLRQYLRYAPDSSDAELAKRQLDQVEKAIASSGPKQ